MNNVTLLGGSTTVLGSRARLKMTNTKITDAGIGLSCHRTPSDVWSTVSWTGTGLGCRWVMVESLMSGVLCWEE